MRRQAVVNANVTFRLRIEGDDGEFSEAKESGCKGVLGVENMALIALCGGIAVILTKSRKRAEDDK